MYHIYTHQARGPVVNHLHIWGYQESSYLRHCKSNLNPMNQLFLTLVRLKRNLKLNNIAFHFGMSSSYTSRCLTTWICFLYNHLHEIDWMSSVEQDIRKRLLLLVKSSLRLIYAVLNMDPVQSS